MRETMVMARRPRRLRYRPPPLSIAQILTWADHEFARTGRWPKCTDRAVLGNRNERWYCINASLEKGTRGLAGGMTLAKLLEHQRGVRNRAHLPDLTEEQIAGWADAHRARTGAWPGCKSGAIHDALGEKWYNLDQALRSGGRGLPGGTSLAQLLARLRGARHPGKLPHLKEKQILAWAKAYYRRTGGWPVANKSGPISEAPEETWATIQHALVEGKRGLPGGDSLARLLARRLGARNRAALPRLHIKDILGWADAHRRRQGEWPRVASGPVADVQGLTWLAIDTALRDGLRGLRWGSSLAQVLAKYRRARNKAQAPRLTIPRILRWAKAYIQRTAQWPGQASGPIPGAKGETWRAVESALREGLRGLRGGDTLFQLQARAYRLRGRISQAALTDQNHRNEKRQGNSLRARPPCRVKA